MATHLPNRLVRVLACLAGLGAAGMTGGCSLVNPHLASQTPQESTARQSGSLHDVELYSAELRRQWHQAIGDQATLGSASGLALIPIGLTAAYLGAQGGYADTILGLGLGGAGIYLGADYLSSRPRQNVYAEGIRGLSCVDAAMLPIHVAGGSAEAIRTSRAALDQEGRRLEAMVRGMGGVPETERAQLVLQQAKATVHQADLLLGQVRQAGRMMLNAVDQVRDAVTVALIQTEPDFRQLASALGAAIPLRAGQIVSSGTDQTASVPATRTSSKADAGGYRRQIDLVADLTAALEELIAPARAATPSRESLERCGLAVREAFPPAPPPPSPPAPTPAPEPTPSPASAAGRVSQDVIDLQVALRDRDPSVRVDGILGAETRKAAAARLQVPESDLARNGLFTTRRKDLLNWITTGKPPADFSRMSATLCPGVSFKPIAPCSVPSTGAEAELLDILVKRGCATPPPAGASEPALGSAVDAGLNRLRSECKLPPTERITENYCRLKEFANITCLGVP